MDQRLRLYVHHRSLKYLVLFRFNRTTCECGCPVNTFGQVSYGVIKVSNRSGLNITASQSKGNVSVSKVSRTFPSIPDSLSLFPIVPTWKVQCICHLKILNSFTTFYGYILKFQVCKSYYSGIRPYYCQALAQNPKPQILLSQTQNQGASRWH